MTELIVVGASFFLCGGMVGWLLGHSVGFVDGVEYEKRRVIRRGGVEKLL